MVSKCNIEILHTWAALKKFQITPIAAAVLACLNEWPLVIGILTSFAQVLAFRDAVIECDSEILEKALGFARKGCCGGAENEVCKQALLLLGTRKLICPQDLIASVSMFSEPLPTNVASPPSTSFFASPDAA